MQPVLRKSTPRNRLPITPYILRQLKGVWFTAPENAAAKMLWAAVTMCFFGFFRSGEITTLGGQSGESQAQLSWGDVLIDDVLKPTCVQIYLRRSKSDPFGHGVRVYIGSTGTDLCPIQAIVEYTRSRGTQAGPFFVFPDGTPLKKPTFVAEVRKAIQQAGLEAQDYAGHSFRIGAATAAAQAGMEDSLIQTLGRWNSAAFLGYIRTPPQQLAAASARLGH